MYLYLRLLFPGSSTLPTRSSPPTMGGFRPGYLDTGIRQGVHSNNSYNSNNNNRNNSKNSKNNSYNSNNSKNNNNSNNNENSNNTATPLSGLTCC